MKDVALKAGVSSATVSHVLNNSRYVNDETRNKVMKAVHDLNYNINFLARHLRRGTTKLIGFLISNMADYFFTTVANGVESILKENGYNLLIVNADEQKVVEKYQAQMFFNHSVAGVIMAPATEDCGYLDRMFGEDFPIVFIDRKPIGIKRDVILAENTQGIYEATSLLIQKGHSRIAFLSTHIMDVTMTERFTGYKAALDELDIPLDMSLVRIGDEIPKINLDIMIGQGYNFMEDILNNTDATAVIMGNNLSAIGGYYYIKESGLQVPGEMAVIAFDDSLWTSMTTPSISVVSQPGVEIGRRSAQLLINRIEGDKSPFNEIRIQTSLIVRGSC
jgi:LacI family transcriptional regulator